MSVLIVADSSNMRQRIQDLLEARGYQDVLTAESGQIALQFLEDAKPDSTTKVDVVLADADMPGLNGIELCRRIKNVKRLHDAGASPRRTGPLSWYAVRSGHHRCLSERAG